MLIAPTNEAYARKYARELLSCLPSLRCPIPLEPLAEARGIKRIAAIRLDSDGFLFNDGTNLIIYVNSRLSKARQRFTCAHEIGHTYFKQSSAIRPSRVGRWDSPGCRTEFADRNKEAEYLCDIFAVELLMPSVPAERIVNTYGPSFRCVQQLASAFQTSVSAAAWRMCELATENVGILWFKAMGKPNDTSNRKLRLDWGAFPKKSRMYLPRFDAVPPNSLISKCFHSQQPVEGSEKLSFGSLRGTRYLACKYFANGVLALVFLHASPNDKQGYYPITLPTSSTTRTY